MIDALRAGGTSVFDALNQQRCWRRRQKSRRLVFGHAARRPRFHPVDRRWLLNLIGGGEMSQRVAPRTAQAALTDAAEVFMGAFSDGLPT